MVVLGSMDAAYAGDLAMGVGAADLAMGVGGAGVRVDEKSPKSSSRDVAPWSKEPKTPKSPKSSDPWAVGFEYCEVL